MDNEIFTEENYTKEEKTVNIIWGSVFSIIVLVIASLLFI